MTYIQYGAGGIFHEIYNKFKTFEGHVELIHGEYLNNNTNYHPAENIYQWNTSRGYHSEYNSELTYETLSIQFKKSFWLKAYRTVVLNGWRFPRSWEVRTSLRGSSQITVHQSTDYLCNVSYGNCDVFSERLFFVNQITLCDKIDIVLTGTDSSNTWSLAFGALEFYSIRECTINNFCKFSISFLYLKSMLILIIIR